MLQPSVLPPAAAAATQQTAAPPGICARWEISLHISAATPEGDEFIVGGGTKNGLFELLIPEI